MGIKERKERERSSRKKAIMEAAKRVIKKQGVEGMSMNQVADLAELNKATLYLYYSNKDDLIDAIVFEGLMLLEKKFQDKAGRSAAGLKRVLALIDAMMAFYREYPVYFYAMNHQERRTAKARMETPFSVKGNEIASRIFGQVRESVNQGIDAGSIRKDIDVNAFPVLVYAHTFGVMHTIHSKKDIYEDVLGVESAMIEKSALEFIEYYLKK